MKKAKHKLIWLSHLLDGRTPGYAGVKCFSAGPQRSLAAGDSCNTSEFILSSHAGTHVDVPYHFVRRGRTVDEYAPGEWIFTQPVCLRAKVKPGQLVTKERLTGDWPGQNRLNVDLALIKTGFEAYRGRRIYWQTAPGLDPSLVVCLLQGFPRLKAIGIDCLSVTSLVDRQAGRQVHRMCLSRGVRIFEDLSLRRLPASSRLKQVWAFPLRVKQADAGPCSVVAVIDAGP